MINMSIEKNIFKTLKTLNLPTCLRICAETDGSITYLLEAITKKNIEISTKEQYIIKADKEIAELLDIEIGAEVNYRVVTLSASGVVYAYAKSLSPLNRMPDAMKHDLMRADIPIGKILRNHKLETRRDIYEIKVLDAEDIKIFNKYIPLLSRKYKIIHNKQVLMWIHEIFPIDERWDL